MIINFIERYFYLVCFAAYAKAFGKSGFQKSFVEYINEKEGLRYICTLWKILLYPYINTYNSNYREMIDNGKDKLEWERKVDSSAVNSIKYFISGCLNLTLL